MDPVDILFFLGSCFHLVLTAFNVIEVLLLLPFSVCCCCSTASFCLTVLFAFSKLQSASKCRLSESVSSLIPTNSLSVIISFLKSPYFQLSARLYNAVIYCSDVSPSCWFRLLKRAHSKITFLQTLKNSLNSAMASSYFPLALIEISVEASTFSASSPKQYSNVLTCPPSPSVLSPEAT